MSITTKFSIYLSVAVVLIALPTQAFELSFGEPWAAGQATFFTSPVEENVAGLSSNNIRDAFIEAMSEWTTKSNFDYLPTTGSADPCLTPSTNVNNNSNGYTFASTSCGNVFQGSTLAVAITWHLGSMGEGPTIQSGVVFNSNSNWSITNVGGSGFDFRRVAVHELGHSLGLAHSTVSPAIMLPAIGSLEVPQTDDLNGVAALYGVFDTDGDDVPNNIDNCPNVSNQNQTETGSAAGVGDACDPDDDGIRDDVDNCPADSNFNQADFNNDGAGDACDNSDGDSLFDNVDNCPLTSNQDQVDFNNDNQGDVCDDTDNDTIFDDLDNCRETSNQNQNDINIDGQGDVCDDTDEDTILDDIDNCPFDDNEQQENLDQDLEGDACDNDADGDGVNFGPDDSDDMNPTACSDIDGDDFELDDPNASCDDCSSGVFDPNNDGSDSDGDGLCDAFEDDDDGDGINDNVPDNCPTVPNFDQADSNNNGIGDACEENELCLPIKASNNKIAVICL